MDVERGLTKQYAQLCKDEETFYKQRSWVQCLNLGDKNTKFFHRSLLHLQVRNKIHGLTNETGARMIDQ